MNTNDTSRLLSIDVMRGLTIALMIVVNNQVGPGKTYPFLNHVLWDGLSFADIVFPSFMFIMGVCASFSLRRMPKHDATRKAIWRGCKIVIIGIMLTWLAKGISGVENLLDFPHLRLTGVLVRLGICYIFASLIFIYVRHKSALAQCILGILAIYTVILILFDGLILSEDNIISVIDRAIIGCDHMYHKRVGDIRICFDPEGLLSNLPGIAHVLIGMMCGEVIAKGREDLWKTVAILSLSGGTMIIIGFFLNPLIPINKNLWTPSFVFATCGGASVSLALLMWILDIRKNHPNWLVTPACVFGVNPLVLYCFSYLLEEGLGEIHISGVKVPHWFSLLLGGQELGALCWSLLLVGICFCIGYPLYRRNIIIKI